MFTPNTTQDTWLQLNKDVFKDRKSLLTSHLYQLSKAIIFQMYQLSSWELPQNQLWVVCQGAYIILSICCDH